MAAVNWTWWGGIWWEQDADQVWNVVDPGGLQGAAVAAGTRAVAAAPAAGPGAWASAADPAAAAGAGAAAAEPGPWAGAAVGAGQAWAARLFMLVQARFIHRI